MHPVVTVRLYGDLSWFAPDAARDLDVPFGADRSVKDLLESLGVPHPEIGLLLVDGQPVGFGHPVRAGQRVAAYPPFTMLDVPSPLPQPPTGPAFVLDVHLGTLARRLRVLGLDVDYARDRDDVELARIAAAEDRVLLTRDRGLLMRREVVHGYCPRADDPDQQLVEVAARFLRPADIRPSTRCPRCGAPLRPVDRQDVAAEVGAHTLRTAPAFQRCTGCGQVYWPGSHADDLQAVVARARQAAGRR